MQHKGPGVTTQILRHMILEVRMKCGKPKHAPSVVNFIMDDWQTFRSFAFKHRAVGKLIFRAGLSHEVRGAMKRIGGDDDHTSDQAKQGQIDLWPEECRAIVDRINKRALYVPSREEFVELDPEVMEPEELREAGEYLLEHGQGEIRRGNDALTLYHAWLKMKGAA